MGRDSAIEWTDHTFNPWWGCQKVSPGCEHCYAETLANRFGTNIWGPPHATDRRLFGPKHWDEPRRWNAHAAAAGSPARVFVASMADVFENHPDVVDSRGRLFDLIEDTPWLTWLILTKRLQHVPSMVPAGWMSGGWPRNAWLGTSVEDQQRADERIPVLSRLPAAKRFLSVEPLLGPVDLRKLLRPCGCWLYDDSGCDGAHDIACPRAGVQPIDWIIVGGESGPGARPMRPQWVRDILGEALRTGTDFMFKQWGAYVDIDQAPEQTAVEIDTNHNLAGNPQRTWLVGKKKSGRELDGRTWDECPPLPSPLDATA